MNDHGRLDTKLVHGGEPRPPVGRAVTAPIFQSATYLYGGESDYDSVWYTRLNNTPNQLFVSQKIALIEGTEAATVTGSGMAAITTALLALVPEGGHVLAQEGLYGGTHHFFKENYRSLGRSVSFFPVDEAHRIESYLTPQTRAIYVEPVSNPLLRVIDLRAVVEAAKRRGILTLIDNTFPSPVNFNPASLGFDVVLHSATKYLNGHSDVVAGAIAGRAELVRQATHLLNHLGGCLDPHACYLLMRGMKTLGVRVRAQSASALALARSLEGHGKVERVFYPGLPSHPDHARAKELFRGFGAMLAFEYRGSAADADRFLHRLRLPAVAPSLGGVESLVTRPATTSHSGMTPADRLHVGIKDTLIRVSVGLEDVDDLVEDFRRALDASA